MPKNRKLHRPSLKTWQLVLILFPLLFLTASFLRLDHIRMAELRDAVLKADELGDDEALSSSIRELKSFVSKNIIVSITETNGSLELSFGTGPFYLEHSYHLAADAALSEAETKLTKDDNNPYGNIYILASDVCKPLAAANGWIWSSPGYINCMTTEIQKYPSSSELVDTLVADIPSTELYRREFSSPLWAPSFSGFFVLLTLAVSVVIFIRFLIWLVLRLSLLFFRN